MPKSKADIAAEERSAQRIETYLRSFDEAFAEHKLSADEREELVWRLAAIRMRSVVEKLVPRPYYQFPIMLRKMWSGTEVQEWLDEHVNTAASPTSKEPGRG